MLAKLIFTIEEMYSLRLQVQGTPTREQCILILGTAYKKVLVPTLDEMNADVTKNAQVGGIDVIWNAHDEFSITLSEKKYLGADA